MEFLAKEGWAPIEFHKRKESNKKLLAPKQPIYRIRSKIRIFLYSDNARQHCNQQIMHTRCETCNSRLLHTFPAVAIWHRNCLKFSIFHLMSKLKLLYKIQSSNQKLFFMAENEKVSKTFGKMCSII